jgi:hypothetical protein
MRESEELRAARRCLAEAEAELAEAGGLESLREGLRVLDDLIATGPAAEARTARNLAATYASRFYGQVRGRVIGKSQVPEPLLEHYFKVVLAFDVLGGELTADATALKVAVVRALIERYYEGHPPEAKRRALTELAKLGGEAEP